MAAARPQYGPVRQDPEVAAVIQHQLRQEGLRIRSRASLPFGSPDALAYYVG